MSRLSYNVSFFVRLKESCAEWIRKRCCCSCSLFAQTYWSLGGGKKASSLRPLTDATGTFILHLLPPNAHCIRSIGQTKPVHVYQLIAENTVESKVGCHEA